MNLADESFRVAEWACGLDAGESQHRSEQEQDEHAAEGRPHPQLAAHVKGESSASKFKPKQLIQDV